MNSVSLVGNLATEPQPRQLRTGIACRLRVAVNRRTQDGAVFIDVDTFGSLADVCAEHLHTGRLVAVHGGLDQEEWEKPNGKRRQRHIVVGNAIDFLDRPST